MIGSMDLNAPEPEEDEVFPEPHSEEDNGQEEHVYNEHAEHGESTVQISRREREERIQRLKRQGNDDGPLYVSQLPPHDDGYQMKRQRPHNKLPPGWLDCPAFGQELNCVIPSKMPLGESFNDYILPGRRYSFRQVIHQQRVLGRKLGLVIDLTNSSRYYVINDCRKEGIKHVKIPCKGRDSVHDNEAVNRFFYEVAQFLTWQKQSKKYILVHCTHGHNRTGYMIIHYLMRTQPISVTQAIKLFADARPLGIYKPDYIDALYNFYRENKPEMVVCPPTLEWKSSLEFDLIGEAVPDEDDEGFAAPPHESHETQLLMTNDDILGDIIPVDHQETVRQFCYQSLKLPGVVRGNPQFPGSHPVSLNRDNLRLLRQTYYYATWKADGTLYMMLITMDGCYLIDRHFVFRRVQMRFPCRLSNEGLAQKVHHFTLLDGEMILDTLPDSQKKERRYLIYDMMAINQVQAQCARYSAYLDGIEQMNFILKQLALLYTSDADMLISSKLELCVMCLTPQSTRETLSSVLGTLTSEEDVWVWMKVRLDKGTPNDFNTYRKVMRSINDNITEEILLNEINEIISLPMYADRIQSENKAHQHYNSSRRR